MSLLISSSSAVMIWYMRWRGLQQHFTILTKLWALISILLIAVPSIIAYYLNSLFIKFLPILYIIISGGLRYILIQYIYNISHVYLALMFCSYLLAQNCVPLLTIYKRGALLIYIILTIIEQLKSILLYKVNLNLPGDFLYF